MVISHFYITPGKSRLKAGCGMFYVTCPALFDEW